jgi:hypothetical protein
LFIDFDELKHTILLEFSADSCSPVVKSLVYATLAIGIHIQSAEHQSVTQPSEPTFRRALGELGNVLVLKDSLLKLQVSLAVRPWCDVADRCSPGTGRDGMLLEHQSVRPCTLLF